MKRRGAKGRDARPTRKGSGSSGSNVTLPKGFSKAEWARLAAFAAAATKLRRSVAAKAVWARRKAAAASEAAAQAKIEALRQQQTEARRAKVAEAKAKLRKTLAQAAKPPKTQREAVLQRGRVQDALENIVVEAKGGSSEEKARAALQIQNEVVLGREAMEDRLKAFYGQQVAAGKVRAIKPGRKPGILYKRSGPVHEGFIRQKRIGKLLSQMSREEIAEAASAIAEKLRKRQPQGKLFASISFFEYGRGKPGYYTVGEDALGVYVQSFDALGNPHRDGALDSVDAFEGRLRELLLKHSTEHNAVLLDTIEVKTFREKNEEERREFSRKRYLARKARIAKRKGL